VEKGWHEYYERMGSMKAGRQMMGNGGMKAKKGMEPKSIMESIDLGNRRPEGIASAAEAPYVYTSEVFFGGIKKVNLETGEYKQIVEPYGYLARGAGGLKYYEGAIFAAGAGPQLGIPGLLYVYDSETGEEIVACAPPGISLFLNDLIVYKGKVYVTDSSVNTIFVVDADAALKGECIVSSIELPEELFLDATGTGQFFANGIVGYEGGLLIARSVGGLYYVDLNDEIVRESWVPPMKTALRSMVTLSTSTKRWASLVCISFRLKVVLSALNSSATSCRIFSIRQLLQPSAAIISCQSMLVLVRWLSSAMKKAPPITRKPSTLCLLTVFLNSYYQVSTLAFTIFD
jgi:hypothetical protein